MVRTTYRQRLKQECRFVHLYGLDERRRTLQNEGMPLELAALYVPLDTTELQQVPLEQPQNNGLSTNRYKTQPISLLEVVGREQHTIVQGTFGSARSTFVRYLAHCLTEAAETPAALEPLASEWQHGLLEPILVDLGQFALGPFADPEGKTHGLVAYIAAQFGIEPAQFVEQILTPGGTLLLLDGLECAEQAVQDLWCEYSDLPNHWIITALDYPELENDGACSLDGPTRVNLSDLTAEQIDQFVKLWYAEWERKGWIDNELAQDQTGLLCASLRRSDIFPLARRRSLLLLICLLYTLQGRLPANPTLFYHALMKLTIEYWSEGTGELEHDLRQVFDPGALGDAIAHATYQAYSRIQNPTQIVELTEGDLRSVLSSICPQDHWQHIGEMVSRLLSRPGLVQARRPGIYSFVHPFLQTYVASHYLVQQPELVQLIVHLAGENIEIWRPVILFSVSRLIQFHNDLDTALAIGQAFCPQTLSEAMAALEQPSSTQFEHKTTEAQVWQFAWLAGECLIEIEKACSSFPSTEAPLLDRTRDWLAAALDWGVLKPEQRAEMGRVLSCLPGGDHRRGVSDLGGWWCSVPASPYWHGEGEDSQLVTLPAFWIGRYPVTNTQYASFVQATGNPPPAHWRGDRPANELGNHPVAQVTWKDAAAYCNWLQDSLGSEHLPGSMGYQIRLPTSQEWEKAARGGVHIPDRQENISLDNPMSQRAFPWGDRWQWASGIEAGDETRCNVSESGLGTTTPVGIYPEGASPYGVLDMAGNVWEWCADWDDNNTADTAQTYKVRRGGAYNYSHDQARCSTMDKAHPGLAWPYLGFRIVFAAPIQED